MILLATTVLMATLLGTARGQALAIDGVALPGVEVCVKGTHRCTLTNDSGKFQFSDVPFGEPIPVSLELPGFGSAEGVLFACREPSFQPILIGLTGVIMGCTDSGSREGVTYVAQGRVVSGTTPVARAEILMKSSSGAETWRGRSDRHGAFLAKGFPGGTYVLEVRKRGYRAQRTTFQVQYCAPYTELTIPLVRVCR